MLSHLTACPCHLTPVLETPMFHEHLSGICIPNRGARLTASCPSFRQEALLGLSRPSSVLSYIYTHFSVSMTSYSAFGSFRVIVTRYHMSRESSASRRA